MSTTDAEIVPSSHRIATSRRRRRSRITTWSPALLAVVALAVVAGHAYGGSANAHSARANAARELRWTLQPGEILLAELPAVQRYWWNYFSETHGVLALTDQRVLFVGTEPPSLTAPNDGPPTFEMREFPHDRPVTLAAGRIYLGTASGLVIGTPEGRETIALDARGNQSLARQVAEAINDARTTHHRELELDELANMPTPLPPPIYREHRVRRGETLSTIARRHSLTADELRELNELDGDAIQAGQRLLVPVIPD